MYFDDLKIEVTKSPVVQSQDYYPFGLTFNSYARENSVSNKMKFGGKEEQSELALNTIDWGWRQYDPAIGRWNVVDQ
jgi:RHS repeat-associated protein